jgi:hypothetical protein
MRFLVLATVLNAAVTNAAYSGDIVKYWYLQIYSLYIVLSLNKMGRGKF